MSRRKHAIEAHFQTGTRLHGAGQLAAAAKIYQEILAAAPSHADSLRMLGVIALQSNEPATALALVDKAIALRPAAALYHVSRAQALHALRQSDAAAAACQDALRLKRNCGEASQTLGDVLSESGHTAAALAAYQEAVRHNPGLPHLHDSLGLALRDADRLEDAAASLREALHRAPTDPVTQSNLAGVLKELGALDEAVALYRAALQRQPDSAVLHFNLGIVLLLAGRMREGWDEYEWRFQAGAAELPACPQPRWSGEPLAGRTVLLRGEQGFGDIIQFCRYVRAARLGGQVVLEVYPRLRRLLAGLRAEGITLADRGGELPASAVQCPLLSLPRLGVQSSDVPYLAAEPDRVAMWQHRLGTRGIKVGIAWQGNPSSQAEKGRSIPLEHFRRLAQVPGVRLISLQQHHGLEQIEQTGARDWLEFPGDDFDAGADAFVDTAAVMAGLDLVISSDTAVAHLAGALGCQVWVALQHVPDWRWMLERSDSPWYPTMRLFRQERRGDWAGVFAAMARALAT